MSNEQSIRDELVDRINDELDKTTYGYKGGEYWVSARENVYLAEYGYTGPAICGLVPAADGVHEPLVVEVSDW